MKPPIDPTIDVLTSLLQRAIKSVLPGAPDEINMEISFHDLGADSVDQVEIVTYVLDHLGDDHELPSHHARQPLSVLVATLLKRHSIEEQTHGATKRPHTAN